MGGHKAGALVGRGRRHGGPGGRGKSGNLESDCGAPGASAPRTAAAVQMAHVPRMETISALMKITLKSVPFDLVNCQPRLQGNVPRPTPGDSN